MLIITEEGLFERFERNNLVTRMPVSDGELLNYLGDVVTLEGASVRSILSSMLSKEEWYSTAWSQVLYFDMDIESLVNQEGQFSELSELVVTKYITLVPTQEGMSINYSIDLLGDGEFGVGLIPITELLDLPVRIEPKTRLYLNPRKPEYIELGGEELTYYELLSVVLDEITAYGSESEKEAVVAEIESRVKSVDEVRVKEDFIDAEVVLGSIYERLGVDKADTDRVLSSYLLRAREILG